MTPKQRVFFFRLFAKACDARGIPPAEREAYRHNLIAHACPVSGGSLRNVGSGEDFDRLMRAVAREAQSAEASQHFATADARRVVKLCEACARQVWEIASGLQGKAYDDDKGNGAPVGAHDEREALRGSPSCHERAKPAPSSLSSTCVAYLRGVLAQAGWRWAIVASGDCWWLDLPLPHAQKLFQMLDTHRRRLLKRFEGRKRERLPNGTERWMRLTFDLESAYRWEDGTLFKVPLEALPEPRVRVRVTA